jgi:hypothetical protein
MVAAASLVPPASEPASPALSAPPRFYTLPPAEVAYRSGQLQTALAEAFAAKQRPAHPVTHCAVCTFPIDPRDRIALRADGTVCHAGCRDAAPPSMSRCAHCGDAIDVRRDVVAIRNEALYHLGSCA